MIQLRFLIGNRFYSLLCSDWESWWNINMSTEERRWAVAEMANIQCYEPFKKSYCWDARCSGFELIKEING